MSPRGEQPHKRGASALQEKVATFYYTLGLIFNTYPVYVLILVATTILTCWFPLLNLPFPGKAPQYTWTSSLNISGFSPFCYVQQVVFKVAVLPWESDLTLGDAFRAPLYEAFKLLEVVRNYEHNESLKTLGHVCLHVEAIKRINKDYRNILPQYSCLVLSPANLWNQDVEKFTVDNSILTTIFNHHSFQKGKTSIAEMLFGMHIFDTGIKRYPLRIRQRILQYAVTLFFKEYDERFITGLHNKLKSVYPLHQNQSSQPQLDKSNPVINDTVLITYPGEINYFELVPLLLAFVLMFFYYYFSVRKIELIKSKVWMAFTVILTVFFSLTMTMGICFFFGLTLSFQDGKAIFPYLAIIVGLENVLVLTKSVVSTPLHLDVKIRNAKGLSKEGWSITKNLLLEITILTFGLFTFVPAIQEFCIFAIVGLLTDFFLQMTFFSTILSLDISRSEGSINEKSSQSFRSTLYQTQTFYDNNFKSSNKKGMNRSKSHPRLTNFPTNVVAAQPSTSQEKKIPKRLRLVNIWARTRFFQRSFMILMVFWICRIAYNSDLIKNYILNNLDDTGGLYNETTQNYSTIKLTMYNNVKNFSVVSANVNYVTYNPLQQLQHNVEYQNQTLDVDKLKHSDYAPWLKLSSRHWPSILRKYNMSLSGKTIAVLPNIKLSHVISPEQAILLRNPEEKYGDRFQWQALAAALDPIDFRDMDSSNNAIPESERPFYPTSPMEILLTTILCIISVIVLAYILVVLYRTICSRNYAEWRASWFSGERNEVESSDEVLLEAVPIVLEGHQQEIECIASDGVSLVSACLGGQLKIWDNTTGQLLSCIDRKTFFRSDIEDCNLEYDNSSNDSVNSNSPNQSPHNKSFPQINNRINTNFSHLNLNEEQSRSYNSEYEFSKSFNQLYSNPVNIRNRNKKKWERSSLSDLNGMQKKVAFNDKKEDFNERSGRSMSSKELRETGGTKLSPIWCIDYHDNLIVIGCADGRLEFWEGPDGNFKCLFEDASESGISQVKIVGSKVIAARLNGTLDFFQLQTYNQGRPVDWNFTCAYRRTHIRTGSVGSISDIKQTDREEEDLQCMKIISIKAHQQPITCFDCEGGRVLSGSQDHTLKVFKLDDGSPIYTLHGHCGPITCLFIDRINPATSGSGSQDGMLCVWDLLTGACVFTTQAHDGSIISLTYSESYVISLGSDEKLCVWERFQGHLLNTIHVSQTFSTHLLMLAPHLVVTTRSGCLVIWDVRSGDCVRTISLGRSPFIFIKQLILLRDAVLCDYGKQLRIVSFPLITHKFD